MSEAEHCSEIFRFLKLEVIDRFLSLTCIMGDQQNVSQQLVQVKPLYCEATLLGWLTSRRENVLLSLAGKYFLCLLNLGAPFPT